MSCEKSIGRVVVHAHERHYSDPIRLKKGEPFTLSGRSVAWAGNKDHVWLWAVCDAGRGGWVARDFPQMGEDGRPRAPYDYDSIELNVMPGERLQVLEETSGWALCRNGQNEAGWVPVRVFG